MKHNSDYQVRQIEEVLVDGKIIKAIRDEDDDKFFGFVVERPDGTRVDVWVDRDMSGDLPGWLNIARSSE